MIDRRWVLRGAVATGAAASSGAAVAAPSGFAGDVELRGKYPKGRLERLPELDLESRLDFVQGFRKWSLRDFGQTVRRRLEQRVSEAGLDPKVAPPLDQLLEIARGDSTIWSNVRCKTTAQQLMWLTLRDAYSANAKTYLKELDDAERIAPGKLRLDPDLVIPDYARHEIHIQPGGYVGDPLGGYVYTYAVNTFLLNLHSEDDFHVNLAKVVPVPADGKVKRILDLGTGVGQLAMALKERFPTAEVCGLDVGAPMLRYAHMRSVDAGLDINYTQALAERTGLPDASFDVITAYILFHEVPTAAARDIVKEAKRLLRPGGVFYPVDFSTFHELKPTAWSRFAQWWDHVHNNEVWTEEYRTSDFSAIMTETGLSVAQGPKVAGGQFWNRLIGTKPVA